MLNVTPIPVRNHDLLAVPLRDRPVSGTGVTVLVVLVAVGLALFSAVRAVLGAVLLLLRPAFVLVRALAFVVGLIVVIGWGLVAGDGDPGPPTRPAPTAPAPPTLGTWAPPTTR